MTFIIIKRITSKFINKNIFFNQKFVPINTCNFAFVKEYDRSGNPVHSKLEKYEQKRLDANASTWKGIIDFALLTQKRFGVESKYITYNAKSISRIFIDFALTPEKKDAHLLKGVFFENKSNAGGYRNLISKGGWKVGYFAIQYSFLMKPFKFLFRKFINPFL